MSAEVQSYLIAFFASSLVSGAIYLATRKSHQTICDSVARPQTTHQGVVPRIGGMAIIIGIPQSTAYREPLAPNPTVSKMPSIMNRFSPTRCHTEKAF